MADRKPDETFRVVDRRMFNAEGELRPEALEEERRDKEAKPAAVLSGKPPSTLIGEKPAAAKSVVTSEAPRTNHAFQLLIDFLARNAAALLGGIADPRTGQPMFDLEGTRELIDMLDALREKTRGNLSPEEDQLLVEVIGSLKMSFLELSKAAAKSMREKTEGAPQKR